MERLLEAWRADPRVDATVELCAMLIRATLKAAGAKLLPDEFVMRFASEARAVHPRNVDVAIAVTDLFLVAGMTDQARGVLEAATEIAPHDGRVHERLDKIGRRRRTAEFTARTADPETLDAPTTPLEPETRRSRAHDAEPTTTAHRDWAARGAASAPSRRASHAARSRRSAGSASSDARAQRDELDLTERRRDLEERARAACARAQPIAVRAAGHAPASGGVRQHSTDG
ncbi:MAG: hypothetical protein U0271_43535 [Polyangiaceae bacterium]